MDEHQTQETEQPQVRKTEARHRVERARLGVISFGLAAGLTAALFVFLLGLAAALFGWGWAAVEILSSIFLGYLPTFVGSVSGAVWAFVDAFAGGVVMAILYNAFLRSRR